MVLLVARPRLLTRRIRLLPGQPGDEGCMTKCEAGGPCVGLHDWDVCELQYTIQGVELDKACVEHAYLDR